MFFPIFSNSGIKIPLLFLSLVIIVVAGLFTNFERNKNFQNQKQRDSQYKQKIKDQCSTVQNSTITKRSMLIQSENFLQVYAHMLIYNRYLYLF